MLESLPHVSQLAGYGYQALILATCIIALLTLVWSAQDAVALWRGEDKPSAEHFGLIVILRWVAALGIAIFLAPPTLAVLGLELPPLLRTSLETAALAVLCFYFIAMQVVDDMVVGVPAKLATLRTIPSVLAILTLCLMGVLIND